MRRRIGASHASQAEDQSRTPLAPPCSAPSARPASPPCLLGLPPSVSADDGSLRHRRRSKQTSPAELPQEPVHDVKADQPAVRMLERFRNGGENRETERLPQTYCVLVGLDDSIELHRRVAILRRDFEAALSQGTSNTPTGRSRRHHEACIGDMTPRTWLIGMKLGTADDCTVIDGDEHPTAGLAHPPCSCRSLSRVGRPAVGVAGYDDLPQKSPNGGPIRIDGITDVHLGILTVAASGSPARRDRTQAGRCVRYFAPTNSFRRTVIDQQKSVQDLLHVHHLPREVFRDGESHDIHRSSHVADDPTHLSAAEPAGSAPKPSRISLLSMVSTSKCIATRVAIGGGQPVQQRLAGLAEVLGAEGADAHLATFG
jgi:hypothetical protein